MVPFQFELLEIKDKYGKLFGQSIRSGSIPIFMSKRPSHWNKFSLKFIPEITDNYIHWKDKILIDNLSKANVKIWRS